MLRLAASLAAIAALPLLAATAGSAFEVQGQQGGAASAEAASFWQRFTLDSGQAGGVALRGHRMPQLAPTLTPMVGLNYENAQAVGAVRGAWLEAARLGPVAFGPVLAVDRHLSLSGRDFGDRDDPDRLARFGGFMAFTDAGAEVGRLALTTGRAGGLDVRASKSFKLNDTVTLDIGPVISLGSFERFGYASPAMASAVPAAALAATASRAPLNVDRAQLGAFGLATAIETRVNDRTVARMFAEYARIDAQRSTPGVNQLQNRDRVDFGFSLTTRIGK